MIRSWTYGLELTVVFVAYFIAGQVGLAIPFTSANVSPVWPAAGIALAAFLVVGYRAWPAIAAAAFVVNYLSSIPFGAAFAIAAGNTAGPAVGAWVVRRLPAFRPSLTRLDDVLGLILLAVPVGAAISATVGVTALFVTHINPWTRFDAAWLVWWLGDAIGALLVAPLVLALMNRTRMPHRRHVLEFAVLCSVTVVICLAVFNGKPALGIEKDVFAFVALPLTLWGASRFDIRGAAGVTLLIAGIAVWETTEGLGPFVRNSPLQNTMMLQVFVAVLSAWGLILAAAIAERTHLIREHALQEGLEQKEQRYRAIVETAHDGIWMLDDDLTTVFVNPSMATMLGYTMDEMRGRCLSDFVSETAWTDKRESLRRPGAEHGERAQVEYRRKDGSVLSADVSRTRAFSEDGTFTGVLKIVTDTTNQRRVEGERQDALDRLVLLSKAIEQTADGVLISDSAGHIEYVNPAFERTTGYTREEAVCYTQGVIDESNVIEPDHNLWSRILAHQPYSGTLASRNRTGDPYWAHLTITPITDRTGLATHSVAVLTDVTDARKYHEQEVRLRLARAVQQRLNPSPPLLPGFDIAAASVLADETGGDYCDFVELPSGVLYVAIGDVSGHGFDAALVMALTRAYTRSFATLGLDVGEVLARTNRALIGDLEGNRFVTMLLVRIDAVQRVVTYAGAGHLPAILLDDSGNIETAMESTGLPLGLFADAVFASRDIRFTTRETLVLSTDGITETSNSDGLEFGRHGLIEFVRSHAAETAEEIAAGILGAARSFGGAEPQLDDATCVIVKVTDPAWGIEDPAASVKHAVALAESAGSLA